MYLKKQQNPGWSSRVLTNLMGFFFIFSFLFLGGGGGGGRRRCYSLFLNEQRFTERSEESCLKGRVCRIMPLGVCSCSEISIETGGPAGREWWRHDRQGRNDKAAANL